MKNFIIPLIILATLGCGSKGANENNDTGFGEDGGAGETGDGPVDPEAVIDHGISQYCVDRAVAFAETREYMSADDYLKHEIWYTPLARAYTHHLDLEDKPSPISVPIAIPVGWPMFDLYANDAAQRGGSPSGLVSGYHFQIPWVGTSDYIDPSDLRFPYSRDIIPATIGNPPGAGRHTWMGPGCCPFNPTEDELSGPNWAGVIAATGMTDTYRSAHSDCRAYVRAMGVHDDAAGYPSGYEHLETLSRDMMKTRCISWGEYPPSDSVFLAAHSIGDPVPYHPTRFTEQWPANINYDWAATLGLIDWADFEAFGTTVDAVLKALLTYLYLPPDDFVHARYGAGGACHFPTSLRWSDSQGGIIARYTCPIGYYALFPDFYSESEDFRANGIVGSCVLEGVDRGHMGLGLTGDILAPQPRREAVVVDGVLRIVFTQSERHFFVIDPDAFGLELTRANLGGVTPELAGMLVDPDGEPLVFEGDDLAWWSSPWGARPIADAMKSTLGYDVDELMLATSWSRDEAIGFVDKQDAVQPLGDVLDVPDSMMDRPTNTLRAGNTWRLRVERGDEVMFFFFVQPGPEIAPD